MTKISVIIPVYNVEKYLSKCIESVLEQDFSDYEIILIDDGSTDTSGKLCDEYAENYSAIKVIHQQNKGLGGARNTGIEAAEGQYLLFVDSDDYIRDNIMTFLYDTAVCNDSDIVAFGMDYVYESGGKFATRRPISNGTKDIYSGDILHYFSTDSYAWNKFFKYDLFRKSGIKYPEHMWYEDLCVNQKIALFAEKVTLTDRVFYEYLQRDNSIMHIKNTDKNSDMLTVVSDILDFYRKKGALYKYYNELCFMTVMHMMVLCTLRVAADNPRHPLLKQFYDFTYKNFPDFKKNEYVRKHLTRRHKVIFAFSKHRMYGMLKLLDKLNKLR